MHPGKKQVIQDRRNEILAALKLAGFDAKPHGFMHIVVSSTLRPDMHLEDVCRSLNVYIEPAGFQAHSVLVQPSLRWGGREWWRGLKR